MFTSFNHLSQSATASYLLSPCANYYLARARYSKSHMRDSNCRVRDGKSYSRDKNKKPPGLCTKVYHDDRQAVWYNLNPKLYLFPYSLIRYIMCKSEAGLVWEKKKKKKACNMFVLTAGVWFQSSIWFRVHIFTRRHENHPIQSPGGRHGVKIWHVAFCLRIALILKSSSSRSSPQTEDKYWTVEQYGARKRAHAHTRSART